MKALKSLMILVVLLVVQLGAYSGEHVVADSMEMAAVKAAELAEEHGAANVLMVFDIDDTLLTDDGDLGGAAWFSWQEGLLFGDAEVKASALASGVLVAPNFDELLRVQGLLFSFSKASPSEAKTVRIVRALQNSGHPVIALTSRGSEYYYMTLRELLRNGYNLARTAVLTNAFYQPTVPYETDTVVAKYGFEADRVKDLKLDKKAKTIQYRDGTILSSGQHKGVILKIFLAESGFTPKAIVFVDDLSKHTGRVQDGFENVPSIDVTTIHYTHGKPRVDAFSKSDKAQVIEQWNAMKRSFEEGNPETTHTVLNGIFGQW